MKKYEEIIANKLNDEVLAKQMVEHFVLRTRAHLFLVRKWSDLIAENLINDARVSIDLLDLERNNHDEGKWLEPEVEPYIWISWKYREKRYGRDFEVPQEQLDNMHEATFHHIKSHKHHPEYWDSNVTLDSLNKENRDKPAEKMVDGTNMPYTYLAAMCADWFAMSEELGTDPAEWARANCNIRWKFTDDQERFIYELILDVWKVCQKQKV